ncbi:MAG: hypothetical protein JWM88_951, partial [Verrucomicrobia bacterium]|nr:hypothetical protein [Verrucomicrobiota bacterium]
MAYLPSHGRSQAPHPGRDALKGADAGIPAVTAVAGPHRGAVDLFPGKGKIHHREIACLTLDGVNTARDYHRRTARTKQPPRAQARFASDYMDDTPAKENPPKDFNKLDLSQLQGFSFGTQWVQDKAPAPDRTGQRSDRPSRDGDRREAPRDRRAFRKPAGPG